MAHPEHDGIALDSDRRDAVEPEVGEGSRHSDDDILRNVGSLNGAALHAARSDTAGGHINSSNTTSSGRIFSKTRLGHVKSFMLELKYDDARTGTSTLQPSGFFVHHGGRFLQMIEFPFCS